jgi:small subunit ribosomal protein S8
VINDPIADLLARVRNAVRAGHEVVEAPFSSFRAAVLDVLVRQGYLVGYEVKDVRPGVKLLSVRLKYYRGSPAFVMLRRVSKLGRRVYTDVRDMSSVREGLGVAVLSTSRGVVSDKEARELGVGGEVVCHVC